MRIELRIAIFCQAELRQGGHDRLRFWILTRFTGNRLSADGGPALGRFKHAVIITQIGGVDGVCFEFEY